MLAERGNQRFSVWTLTGEHVADHAKTSRATLSSMQGLNNGTVVSVFSNQTLEGGHRIVARQSLNGSELLRFASPSPPIA